MRIVQVVHGLPPEYLGGTETYAAALTQELARQGHAVSVFARRADPDSSLSIGWKRRALSVLRLRG